MRSHREYSPELSSTNSKNVQFRSSKRAVRPLVKKSLLDIPWLLPSKKFLCRPPVRLVAMYTYETKIDLSQQTHVKFVWPPPQPSSGKALKTPSLLRATPLPILAPPQDQQIFLVSSASAASTTKTAASTSTPSSRSSLLRSVNLLTDTAHYSPYINSGSTYTAIVNPSASATLAELTSSHPTHVASASGNSTISDSKSNNSEKGVVLGSILGGVLGLLAVIAVIFCICRTRRRQRKETGIEKDLMYDSYHSNLSFNDSSDGPPEPPFRIDSGAPTDEEAFPIPLRVPTSPFDAESAINLRGKTNPPPVPPKEIKKVALGPTKKHQDRPGEIVIDNPKPIEDLSSLQNPFLSVEPPSAVRFHPSRRAPPPPSTRGKPQSLAEPFEAGFGTPTGLVSGTSTTPYATPFETPQNKKTELPMLDAGIFKHSIERTQGKNSPSSSIYGSEREAAYLDRSPSQMDDSGYASNRLSAPPSALASSALKSWGFFSPRKSLTTPPLRDSSIYVYDDANADQPGYRMFDEDDLDKLKEKEEAEEEEEDKEEHR